MITRNAPYFKEESLTNGGKAPGPLSRTVERTVRFEEVDAIGMVWHGRYPSYFEDARVAFGEAYGFGYTHAYEAGFILPIKQMGIDYVSPLRFGQSCRITASLHWSEAAKLNFSYRIASGDDGALVATAYTVQLFLTRNGELCMVKPDYYLDFCASWLSGELSPSL